ncbi:LysR family transcriptional regulator [Ktedonospora formicarum]|uniref:Putative HTH-type transcriptional regulator YvbU n=1 Tax=Ktedonospora formicarum TaxID=2778364 RepID=A0A8J3I4D3_9CHLR|nr:LysR family transcriptional regulator [Ktedonospora formicarum]GHO46748.1 putative HTH-type transcriptional regulator YvbU [Ktedonospora formicarum]
MNLSQLQSFIALAETGSFTEAAYAIDLTQSAVSHALSALEKELGVTLIERNRKGVVALTATGQRIIPHARALLASASAIEQEARVERGLAMGKLRLGSMLSIISPNLLASVMTRFQQRYPDMEVVLFEGAMHEVGDWIEKSVIDVGFVLLPPEEGREHTLIMSDELCVLVPEKHRFSKQDFVTGSDLREEGLIIEKSQCALQLMKMAGTDLGRHLPHVRYQASDSATILAMVREGLGVTLMPRMMLPERLDGMSALSLDPPQYLQIGLSVRSRKTISPGANLFIQTALDWMREQEANGSRYAQSA